MDELTKIANDEWNTAAASVIRQLAAKHTLNNVAVSAGTGVGESTVGRYLKAKRPISVEFVCRFAILVGMQPREVMTMIEAEKSTLGRRGDGYSAS